MKYYMKGHGPEYCVFALAPGATEVLCYSELTSSPYDCSSFRLFNTGAACVEITAVRYEAILLAWAKMRIALTPELTDQVLGLMHTVTTATGTYLSDGLARLSITPVNESQAARE